MLNFDKPKICDFGEYEEPTGSEISHIENIDGIALHHAYVCDDHGDGDRWILCWVRVEEGGE